MTSIRIDPTRSHADDDASTLYGQDPAWEGGLLCSDWALIRYMGHPVGEVLLLGGSGLGMGRARDNRVCLSEPEISRYHAKVDMTGASEPAPLLQDLGSTNGTFLNGRQLTPRDGPQLLQNGDVIRLGLHAFKVKHLDNLERSYHETVMAQTTLDHLTGVGNRSSVLAFLDKHTDLSRRHRRSLAIILCDLDHFKTVNDRFGHAVGDQVLKIFATIVAGRLRSSDLVGRIGGEEFLVVLPETGGREARALAEELRRAVAEEVLVVPEGETEFRLTSCFGVAQLDNDDLDGSGLLARADLALYRAKGQGRNRVEFDGMP